MFVIQLFFSERPLFPEDIIAATTRRWMEWESWVLEDNSVCLCARGLDLLEKLSDSVCMCARKPVAHLYESEFHVCMKIGGSCS